MTLPAVGTGSAETVGYTSDGDGLRQSRTVGTSTKQFTWSSVGSLPLLLDDGTSSYIYGPSSAPIAEVSDTTGTVGYLTDDLVGSTRLITSSLGTVTGVNIYDEYGNQTSHTGTATSAFGYSGNWTDPDTGLIYLRARDYDPKTAQFLTVDPLVDSTRQPYAYVGNDPLSRTDSNGCDWLSWTDGAAHFFSHGPGAAVTSFLEGIGDGASFGLTQSVRQLMGTDCQVQKNGFYYGGLVVGTVLSTAVSAGAGGAGDIARGAKFVEEGVDEGASAGERIASTGTRDAERSGDDAESCLLPQSFTPDTNVVLADGKTIPIDRVKVGDKVRAVDTITGKSVTRPVTAVWINHDTDLMDVIVTGGNGAKSVIHATQHHPFWNITTHSWVNADHLRAGDRLLADNGASVTFAGAVIVPGAADMWDLTISGVHDFYVSTSTSTVLVHNNSCDLDSLSQSGEQLDPVDKGGQLTRAGRGLSKAKEVYGPTKGSPSDVNRAGQGRA